jgi:hypothetical protein
METASSAEDTLRAMAELLTDFVIEAEVTAKVGAEPHERSEQRTTRRNGHRERRWDTRLGTLTLQVPKVCEGFVPSSIEHRKRSKQTFNDAPSEESTVKVVGMASSHSKEALLGEGCPWAPGIYHFCARTDAMRPFQSLCPDVQTVYIMPEMYGFVEICAIVFEQVTLLSIHSAFVVRIHAGEPLVLAQTFSSGCLRPPRRVVSVSPRSGQFTQCRRLSAVGHSGPPPVVLAVKPTKADESLRWGFKRYPLFNRPGAQFDCVCGRSSCVTHCRTGRESNLKCSTIPYGMRLPSEGAAMRSKTNA